ncbi:hypothetical protein HMPREF9104_03162 [Lentilactobacillus kisonensis F0435]|nr:hypothetical protein HMPREF9104_03162 [Lentilactobacillus kisonensis F0435]
MSDGMFAILITILVLDFKLPEYRVGHLLAAILQQWPILLAYVVSFAYIGTLWLFHHDFFSTISQITPALNIINLLVLFSITLINYATSLISATLSTLNVADLRTAIIIYDICALLISFTFELMYRYVYRHPELKEHQRNANEEAYFIKSDPIISVGIYFASIIISFFSVIIGGAFLLAGIIWHATAYVRLSNKVRRRA